MRLKPIAEQVVVVMGASSGIGRQTALELARRGARVVVSARNEESLQSLVEEIRSGGGEALAVPADVTCFEEVKAVADRAAAHYGRLDTWVHGAGVGLWALFEETRPEEWRRAIDVNLNGQAYGAMAALPHLKQGGALIHISSTEGMVSLPYQAAYAAAKHGVHGMIKAVRLEVQRAGLPISVTEVMPSGVNTPIFSSTKTRIGTKPRPFSPFYDPRLVTKAIIHAAENPTPEIVVGGMGRAAVLGQLLAPQVVDRILLTLSFQGQHTRERKGSEAPSNLFQPLDDPRVDGDFSHETRRTSAYTWLERHPSVQNALKGALVGSAVAAAVHLLGRRRGHP